MTIDQIAHTRLIQTDVPKKRRKLIQGRGEGSEGKIARIAHLEANRKNSDQGVVTASAKGTQEVNKNGSTKENRTDMGQGRSGMKFMAETQGSMSLLREAS